MKKRWPICVLLLVLACVSTVVLRAAVAPEDGSAPPSEKPLAAARQLALGLAEASADTESSNLRQGGDTCATAVALSGPLPITVSGTTSGYTNDYDEACPFSGSDSPDVVYEFIPSVDMEVTITLCGDDSTTAYDSKLYLYKDDCPDTVAYYACNDDACSTGLSGGVSELNDIPMASGSTYFIVIDGKNGAAGNYQLDINREPPECPPHAQFSQPPDGPEDAWTANASDVSAADTWYESYSHPDPFDDVRFWGLLADGASPPLSGCVEDPLWLDIKFYEDDAGNPGNEACVYSLAVSGEDTGLEYDGLPLYEFDIELPSLCATTVGWVSVRGTDGDPNCLFHWMSSGIGDGMSCHNDGLGFSCGAAGESDFDLSICLGTHRPFDEFDIAESTNDWANRLDLGSEGGLTPITSLGLAELQEIAELGMEASDFRKARIYPVEDIDSTGMDALVMAFGDDPVALNTEVVAGFDFHIGYLYPGGYGFWSGHEDEGLRWCYRRLQFWNYWYWPYYYLPYPYRWWSRKLIVFYDVNGNRLLIDYSKWWRWWPWPYRYWWKYRVYPWYPWPWVWWRPFTSWRVIGPFQPWRVVKIRFWETAWWYPLRPRPPWPWLGPTGRWWPPTWPWFAEGGLRQDTPQVPWNAWGAMKIEAPDIVVPACLADGDADSDGDIDLADFAYFQRCFRDANGYEQKCPCFDIAADGEIDCVEDLTNFVSHMTGPG